MSDALSFGTATSYKHPLVSTDLTFMMNLPDSYLDLTLRSVLALYGKPRKGDKKPVPVSAVLAAVNVMAKRTVAEQKATEREQPKKAAKKKARPRKK